MKKTMRQVMETLFFVILGKDHFYGRRYSLLKNSETATCKLGEPSWFSVLRINVEYVLGL